MPETSRSNDSDRKILIYGINYAPEMIGVGRFTGEIGAHLAELGYDVRVVAAPPHYPGWRVVPPYSALAYAQEDRDGVRVQRCPILLRERMSGIWRLVAPLSFAMSSAPLALWILLTWRPALVLCVEPTFMVAPVGLLGKCVGSRVILHVQDLEIDAAFAVGYLKGKRVKALVAKAESFLLRQFTSIITISAQMMKRLVAKGVEPVKLSVVRNWVDLGQIKPLAGPNRFRKELGLAEKDFVVLYAGNIGAKQALNVVVDAARMLACQSRVHFVIAGDGPEKPGLMGASADLLNVHFLPLQPEERLCELLNLADLHVLPQMSGAADLVLPSKLGGMLASGKPTLVTADPGTELFEVLRGTSILVPSGDSAAMAREIGALVGAGCHPALGDGRLLARSFAREACLDAFHACLLAKGGKHGFRKP
jgi:colanic acid biosynthesis glycosyl transferase WcaI